MRIASVLLPAILLSWLATFSSAAELPSTSLPLSLQSGERIAFVGNSLGERMNIFGNFETLLHSRHPSLELVVRNFCRPADEVGIRQRAADYHKIDDPLAVFAPQLFLCFFGYNESFAGPEGVAKFKSDYNKFLDEYATTYALNGKSPRFVLISPIAFESSGDRLMPAGTKENANLKLYTTAIAEVAKSRGLAFVDLFAPTAAIFGSEAGLQYTINGAHVNAAGDREVGVQLDRELAGGTNPAEVGSAQYEKIRNAINDKSWVHLQDYRMLNGWYVYGGRRTWDLETFPLEYAKIRKMASIRDRFIWDMAQGKQVAEKPDDSGTGDLIVPATRFGEPRQKYSEDQEAGPRILPPEDFIKTTKVPPGFELKLFADETRFPEIAKPVQMSFDNQGRLWVSTMPSYPQWRPGDPKPSDKLVILEDTDGDGQADKSTVFYDQLHCPTGFEFYNGGVLVVSQPRMLWLKDNNGDDKADEVVEVLDGFATEDTHHTVGAFESNHGGQIRMLEGGAMSTTVETPWGPLRNYGSPGSYTVCPRTWKINHFVTPGYGNPWCYVFNEWGQGFCGDGTTASQHWDTPLTTARYGGRKGLNVVFDTEGMRPVVGSEFLVSRHYPDEVQGQFTYACVIRMNGMPRWNIVDDGAGYRGTRVRHNPDDPKTFFDLLTSTDKHFRPVDPQIGPDGALWFGDWANPLIGHMQYSQRDPNRDHIHGRVYRLVYTQKPLLKPVTQKGKSLPELLEQLREYEWRTRARARLEIHSRPEADVLAAVKNWISGLDANDPLYDRLMCEALWIQQSFHAVDQEHLNQVLSLKTPDARAAAVHVLTDEREYLADVQSQLTRLAVDAHPRVRTEVVRGLSYFPGQESAVAVLAALQLSPEDYWLKYTADAALGATLTGWRGAFLKGELAREFPVGKEILNSVIATDKKGAELVPYLQVLIGKEQRSDEERNKAMQALGDIKGGNVENGKNVFRRNCVACHKVFNEGGEFGPDIMKVGTRLSKLKIIESIIDPNAELNEKYLTTMIVTDQGKLVSGLLVSETPEAVVIFDGKEKRTIPTAEIDERKLLRQSSMPDGLAGTISPVEFLDVITFLESLK
ncbi:PVC-type heme-binding CxxCH protein [Planctomicrobium sp. SH527]|uniref:PVC-type heme-binding CxxCH protein n=1 Tax=Planctomicrobium sp. SH527 TaxID=3448123 RepID=UPI003F5C4480